MAERPPRPLKESSFYQGALEADQRRADFPGLAVVLLDEDDRRTTSKNSEYYGDVTVNRLENLSIAESSSLLVEETFTDTGRQDSELAPTQNSSDVDTTTVSSTIAKSEGFPCIDDQFLRQFQIQAKYEATHYCKLKMGYNPENVLTSVNHDFFTQSDLTAPTLLKPEARKPVLKKIALQPQFQLNEPCIPPLPSRPPPAFPIHGKLEGPEFCRGVLIPDETDEGSFTEALEDHRNIKLRVAQCMECRKTVGVPLGTSLMVCPNCNEVSPALACTQDS